VETVRKNNTKASATGAFCVYPLAIFIELYGKIIDMVTEPLDNQIPEDIFNDSSEPDEFDEWFHTTHKDTRAMWEEPNDSDDLDFELLERDED
jgi:hypothetical protein